MAYIGQRPVIGRYIKLDQISSGFNGSNTGFSMTAGSQAVFPGTARNLLLSLGGVIQEPDTDFTISGSTLTFTTAPVANTTFFGVIYGDMQATGTPSDGTVLPASIASSGNFSFPEVTVTGDLNAAGDIVHVDDTNTKIRFSDNDQIKLETGSVQRLKLDGTEVVFNDDGASVDFRVEGDTSTHLLFVDASADKVGIGVSNPANTLEISGTFQSAVAANTGSYTQAFNITNAINADFNVHLKTGSTTIGPGTTTPLCFHIGGTANEKMRIHSDGNVGIGTTSPDRLLHVRSTGDALFRITSGDGSAAYIELGDASNGDAGKIVYDNGDNLTFTTTNPSDNTTTEKLRIQGNGNVGIGETGPSYPTEIKVSDTTAYSQSTTNSTQHQLRINNAGLNGVAGILLTAEPSSGSAGHAGIRVVSPSSGKADMTFSVRDAGTYDEKLRILNDGNVGIGTTSPSDNLEIASGVPTLRLTDTDGGPCYHQIKGPGNGDLRISCDVGDTSSSASEIQFDIHDDNKMVIQSTGNVGIGTQSPASLLTLNHATNPAIQFQDSDTKVASINSEGSETNIASYEGKSLVFSTSSGSSFAERVRFDTDGAAFFKGGSAAEKGTINVESTDPFIRFHDTDGATDRRKWDIRLIGASSFEELDFRTINDANSTFISRMQIEYSGDVNISDGNLRVASGHGIDFSAAGHASGMTSELLDDYEEGTWTPSFNNAGGFSSNSSVGKYTKIGRVVHWVCQVVAVRDTSSSSGTFTISGLPFTSLNQATGGHGYAGCMGALFNWNIPDTAYQIGIRVPDNNSLIQFFANFDNAADSQLTSPFDANKTIFGSLAGTYIT